MKDAISIGGKARQAWRTPRTLGANLVNMFYLNLDAAADDSNKLCPVYWSEADDGLSREWNGRVWCNPPFSGCRDWVEKAIEEVDSRRAQCVIMLLPAHVGLSWFTLAADRAPFWLFDRRIKYEPPDGVKASSPAFGSVLFEFTAYGARGCSGILDSITGKIIRRFR
jgi:phage N-6-adenine-methyltransferase